DTATVDTATVDTATVNIATVSTTPLTISATNSIDNESNVTEKTKIIKEMENIYMHDSLLNPSNEIKIVTNFSKNNEKKKKKIIIIIGVTCSGKTKFSIDLCKKLLKYNITGEIISADSMQVYERFGVGTAKINKTEMENIKHHMLDICKHTKEFNAHKFIKNTIPLIDHMYKNNKVAVVTGGTMLYIESLLWESVIDLKKKKNNNINIDRLIGEEIKSEGVYSDGIGLEGIDSDRGVQKINNYEKYTNSELYSKLSKIDPERAKQLHENDRKRVCRSLDIFYTYNKKHSDLIKLLCHKNKNKLNKARYEMCIFYLDYENDNVLKTQIEKRVDFMIANNLLEEAMELKQINKNKDLKKIDNKKGIYQSIAYKEFDEYIEKKINNINDENLFNACKNKLIQKTYKYAKKQRKWILNRFVKTYNIPLNKIYASENYEEQLDRAVTIVREFLKN
ncbi:tRNA delta(2)-isopentenylpyrophosphate transferase, putative, partial [Hepatocystis sp. ex Piliocolobus tephrosceles]